MGGLRMWGYMRVSRKSVKIRRLSVGPKGHNI